MPFYGLEKDDLAKVYDSLGKIQHLYHAANKPALVTDNMAVVARNMRFAIDKTFMRYFKEFCVTPEDEAKVWRLHGYCWAARSALSVPGDFVECGVYQGLYSSIMTACLDFERQDKTLYLYDTFAGLDENWSSDYERENVVRNYHCTGVEEMVSTRFAQYSNVKVVKGVVPEILERTAPEKIAFLHLDMNAAQAEIAALDKLAGKLTDGAIVLMDDFGRYENYPLCLALEKWWRTRGHEVLEIPTGQGMVIVRRALLD